MLSVAGSEDSPRAKRRKAHAGAEENTSKKEHRVIIVKGLFVAKEHRRKFSSDQHVPKQRLSMRA